MSIATEGLKIYYDGINNAGTGVHDSAATLWKDLSGNGNDGIIQNATWRGNCLSFDGSGDWVNCGRHNYSQITMEAMFSISSKGSGTEANTVFANFQTGGYGMDQYNGKYAAGIYVNGYKFASGSEVVNGKIVHLTATYDGTDFKLYENSILVSSQSLNGDIGNASNNTVSAIGANPDGNTANGNYLNGKVYSLRLYNRALTEAEVAANYEYEHIRYGRIWEMPVLSANEQTIDGITYTVTADSSIDSGRVPYKAFDGDNADTSSTALNCWHSAKATKPGTHWFMVSMSNPVKVQNISIHHIYTSNTNENHNVKDFIFEGSNDGSVWVSLIEGTCEGVPASSDTFSVENPDFYTKYRLRVVTTYSIYSYEVYAVIGEMVLSGYIEGGLSKKYLIKSENVIYTIADGALQALTETDITASLFQTYGVDAVPDGSLLSDLSNPSVMCWTDAEELPVVTANVTATPQSQTVISNAIDLTHESITGIENMVATCEGDLIIAVSFDNKQTWKAWNGSEWSLLSEEFTGMNKETLEAVTFEQWNLLYNGATGFYIRIALVDTTQSVTEIYTDFAN